MTFFGHGKSEKKDYEDKGSQHGMGCWTATRVSREQSPKQHKARGARSHRGSDKRPFQAQTSKAKEEIVLHSYQSHPAVSVSGNWRIVSRFENGNAYDVDLIDYH
jgi:hypothetical protein